MTSIDLQVNGVVIGLIHIGDSMFAKLPELRDSYLGIDDAADSVLYPVEVGVLGSRLCFTSAAKAGPALVPTNVFFDVGRDTVHIFMKLGADRLKFDITNFFKE